MNGLEILALIAPVSPAIPANQVIQNGLDILYYIVGAVSVIMIIIAGLTMVTSAGNADAVKKAKNTILYAVIGIIFVLLAFTITHFIIGSFK